jgi:amino-acid N-acetyltransferase
MLLTDQNITIRSASPSDCEDMTRLLQENRLPTADLSHDLLKDFLVAADDKGIAGVVGLVNLGETALLRSLCIHPTHRHRGLGQELTERILRHGRLAGVRKFFLLTETAENFFKLLGFRRIDRNTAPLAITETDEFNRLCPVSASLMIREVS